MKAIVTGGAGFIGSFLCEKLYDLNYEIVIIDNLFRGKKENIEHLINGKNKFYNIDISDSDNTEKIKEIITEFKPDYIFHYAAINGTQYFYDLSSKVLNENIMMTFNLVTALKGALDCDSNIRPKLIYSSSSEVYGEPFNIPTKEDDITYYRVGEDRDSYSASKLISESIIRLNCNDININWFILRFFNVYGERMNGTKYGQVIPEFITRLKNNEYPLKILGNGSHKRSFCYVEDNIDMTLSLIEKGKENEIYNVGNDKEISILDLAEIIMKKMNMEVKTEFLPARQGDHMRRMPDLSKTLSYIGKYDFVSLEDGISKILKYY